MPGPNDSLRNRPLVYTPRPAASGRAPRPAPLWRRVPGAIWRALRRTCTALGALVLILSGLGFVSAIQMARMVAPPLPETMVLRLEIDGDIPEKEMESTLSDPFAFRHLSLHQLVETLDHAASDEAVKGLVARIKTVGTGLADVQELRAALRRFRASGKFAYVYGTDYGDPGRGLGTYYLASAFEKIWMQPLGTLSIAGIGVEIPYVKGLLDTIGVQAEFFQRKEFKTAFESLTHSEMTPENRDMMTRMAENLGGQMLSDIAADRGIETETLRRLIDRGLLLGPEALAGKLIDRVDHEDVLFDDISEKIGQPPGDDLPFVSPEEYHAGGMTRTTEETAALTPVALVYITGAIVEDSSGSDESPLLMGEDAASAEDIAQAITQAADDPLIPAIALRINSPGGSPTASETIRRAILRAQKKGKKVVVSMGDVAASGGYWIAAPADSIFALPSTLTGSIGVVGGKFNLAGLWDKIGVRWDAVRWGENAGAWSFNAPFPPAGAERMNAMLDEVYAAFVERVAQGRKMPPASVEKIAGGRVWTGEQAQKIGLVDTLGGLDDALDYTARQIGLAGRNDLDIQILPRPLAPLEHLIKAIEDRSAGMGAGQPLEAALARLKSLSDTSGAFALALLPVFSAR